MILYPLLFGLLVAAVLSILFGVGFRRYGPWEGFVSFFLILALAAWAGALWAQPLGPPLMGFYWLPVLGLTLLVALLLASSTTRGHPGETVPKPAGVGASDLPARRVDGFFWVVIALLVIMILTGYWL